MKSKTEDFIKIENQRREAIKSASKNSDYGKIQQAIETALNLKNFVVASETVFQKDDFNVRLSMAIRKGDREHYIELYEIDSELFIEDEFHKMMNVFVKASEELDLEIHITGISEIDKESFRNYMKIFGFKENRAKNKMVRSIME